MAFVVICTFLTFYYFYKWRVNIINIILRSFCFHCVYVTGASGQGSLYYTERKLIIGTELQFQTNIIVKL